MTNRTMLQTAQNEVEGWHKSTVDTAATYISHEDVQPMAKTAQSAAGRSLCVNVQQPEKREFKEMAVGKGAEKFTMHAKMLRKQRCSKGGRCGKIKEFQFPQHKINDSHKAKNKK